MKIKSVMAGRINCAAGAGPHDRADLRDHAAGQRVAQKNFCIAGQRHHSFLNSCTSGIIQADYGCAYAHGVVHDLCNFLRVGFRERAAEDGEILREDVDQAAIDAAEAGDESVARGLLLFHAEIVAVMGYELVELFEGTFIEKQLDSLAGAEFAFFVLALATLGPPPASASALRRRSSSKRSWCFAGLVIGSIARCKREGVACHTERLAASDSMLSALERGRFDLRSKLSKLVYFVRMRAFGARDAFLRSDAMLNMSRYLLLLCLGAACLVASACGGSSGGGNTGGGGAAVLAVSESTLTFAGVQGSNSDPAPANVNVTNSGAGALSFNAASDSQG